MGICAKAVEWALSIANDDTHGYDQGSRWGPNYDCSSLLIQAYENAGVPVKTEGASYTGNMVKVFKECGFQDVTGKVDLSTGSGLIMGDVVWKSGHTEMCSRSGYLVGAHINENNTTTGGASGDQTGKEIYERTYYNAPWTVVLRYPETKPNVSPISGNRYLTLAEMQNNATYIWYYLKEKGWTMNAVAGLLANLQKESTINPGIWQGLNEGTGPAFGLCQWDPYTKYTNWCAERGLEPSHMDSALLRLEWEAENGEQYYRTEAYPETFKEFMVSTKSAYYLAGAFLYNYERPASPNAQERGEMGEYWFEFLETLPEGSGPVIRKRKGMSLLLMYIATRK